MLLFWRKKRTRHLGRQMQARQNGLDQIETTADTQKTFILLVVLHVYIVICAYVFQHLEYVPSNTRLPNLKKLAVEMSRTHNISTNDSMNFIMKVLSAADLDKKIYISSLWNQFSKAFWFVTILFTTVGTGHIVPVTFYGRLFTIISALIGIPLYALFLKHFGDCVLQVNRKIIRLCEAHRPRHKRGSYKNTKMVLFAFFQMVFIIGMGALGAIPFNWTYFQGVYFCFISLSTVGFGDLIPDLSGDRAFYGVIYMFYNVIGLGFVSCFICTVVNAIDDFNAIREAAKWAANSVRVKTLRKTLSKERSNASHTLAMSVTDSGQDNNNVFKNRGYSMSSVVVENKNDPEHILQGTENGTEGDTCI